MRRASGPRTRRGGRQRRIPVALGCGESRLGRLDCARPRGSRRPSSGGDSPGSDGGSACRWALSRARVPDRAPVRHRGRSVGKPDHPAHLRLADSLRRPRGADPLGCSLCPALRAAANHEKCTRSSLGSRSLLACGLLDRPRLPPSSRRPGKLLGAPCSCLKSRPQLRTSQAWEGLGLSPLRSSR